jgi:hypothetical protein
MEAQILALLKEDVLVDSSKHKHWNNVQFSKKQYPLSKAAKQGKLHSTGEKHLTKAEREPLIANFIEVPFLEMTLILNRTSAS